MKELEVNCVCRAHLGADHQHITHIGHDRNGWRLAREQVVARIEARIEAFFVLNRKTGERSYIGVVRDGDAPPYLRVYLDGIWNDKLLSLPECGPHCEMIG